MLTSGCRDLDVANARDVVKFGCTQPEAAEPFPTQNS